MQTKKSREVPVTDPVSKIHKIGRWSADNTELSHVFFLSPNQMAIILLWSGCVTGQERTNGDFSPLLSSLQKHSTFKGVMGLYVCKQYAKLFCILSTSPQKRVYVTLADMG